MSSRTEAKQPQRWLAEEISSRFSQIVESMIGGKCTASWEKYDSAQQNQLEGTATGILWWEQPLSFPAGASLTVGAQEAAWRDLGNLVLEAAGIDSDPETVRSTYLEILTQALAGASQSLATKLRKEVNCLEGRQLSSAPSFASGLFEVTMLAGDRRIPVFLASTDALLKSLEPEPKREVSVAKSETPAPPVSLSPTKTMDLLLDVELPVSVSFGRAVLPLKDVLKLTSGSIVELNRSISEPVEVIVNNCVIARGEVVVVEGNYGVRIDHIINRHERLRTLK